MNWQGSIVSLQKTISHREFLVRMEWLDRQWNVPSRSDHYLMQIAREICRTRIDPKHWNVIGSKKLDFEEPKPKIKEPKPKTRKEAADKARARLGWLGKKKKADHG